MISIRPPLKKIKHDFLEKIPNEKNFIKSSIEKFLKQINFCQKKNKLGIDLNPSDIKLLASKKETNEFIKIIYDEKKLSCPNCKILCKESLKFEKHLDMHYKKKKEKSLKLNKNGNNFITLKKWINSKSEKNNKKTQNEKIEEKSKNNFIKNLVKIQNFQKSQNCEICEENLKPVWMEDLGKWYFYDCEELVNENGKFIVHQKCVDFIKDDLKGFFEESSKVIKI